jgi:VanZ family protein
MSSFPNVRPNIIALLRALPCAMYLAIIGYYSLQPQEVMPQDVSDKIVHLTAYAAAAMLWAWAASSRRWLLLALPILITYGVGLEFAQGLTPDRTPSTADAIANSLGVVIGVGVFMLLQRSDAIRRMLFLPPRIDWQS